MTSRTTRPLAALLLFGAASLALAGPTVRQGILALLRTSMGSGNPTLAFLTGLGGLGSFTLDQADLSAAVQATLSSGAQGTYASTIDKLLTPTRSLTKKGDQVKLVRTEKTLIVTDQASVEVAPLVKFRLRMTGPHQAVIDDVSGIRVGRKDIGLFDLRKVELTQEHGHPVAKVTAGFLFFSKTVTIDLSKMASHGAPAPKPANSHGMVGALGGH